MAERIWFCKVGGEADFFESGADQPMRRAIAKAFREVTGRDPQFTFSGWGQELTESERAVVEDREPKICDPHLYTCKNCGIEPPTTASALETSEGRCICVGLYPSKDCACCKGSGKCADSYCSAANRGVNHG
jgi:hypothetical protein